MGHNYSQGTAESPAWRTDILHEVDLIEDIAIAYGYNNIIPEIPAISTTGAESKTESTKRKIAEILTGLNFLEISNYHLTTKTNIHKKGLNKKQEQGFIELEESKTEFSILRKDLTHYLLKILSENIDAPYPQKIFEIGKIFTAKSEIQENDTLALAISPAGFTEIKQTLDFLFKMINLKFELKEPAQTQKHFIDGRVAQVVLNKKEIGQIGEIHPKILSNWKTKMPIALCEISLEEIFKSLN